MKRSGTILLIALAVFVASFFLPAIHIPGIIGNIPGYLCAWVTLTAPSDGLKEMSAKPLEYAALTLSGLINPVFVIALALLQRNTTRKAGEILRIVLLFIFPACWIVFFMNHYYLHVGYFLWAAAMVAALFSDSLAPRRTLQTETAPA